MEHDKAKAEVEALYERTLAIVGEDGWKVDTREWRGCGRSSLRDTDSWNRFSQRKAPLSDSPESIAQRVADAWTEMGYPVTVLSDDSLIRDRWIVSYPPFLTGTTADGFGITFSVGADYADFDAGSRCVPSDPDATRYPSAVDG